MLLPQRFIARCFDPMSRWSGRLRAALDAAMWRVAVVDSMEKLVESGSAETSSSQIGDAPALLLAVLDATTNAEAARTWSRERERVNPRSPLVVVLSQAEADGLAYWQELGAAAVLTTTLELPLVLQLAERFATNPANLVADHADPLTPFWQALPWSDALPKAGRGG